MDAYPHLTRSLLYTVSHCAVDALCLAAIMGSFVRAGAPFVFASLSFATVLFVYNLVAFGLQWLWGLALDRFPALPTGFIGVLLLGTVYVPHEPASSLTAMNLIELLFLVALAAGNAAFHVEGGRDSYVRSNGTETRTGVFASGGALGVIVGCFLAGAGILVPVWFWLALVGLVGYLSFSGRSFFRENRGACHRQACRGDFPVRLEPAEGLAPHALASAGIASLFLIVQVLALPGFQLDTLDAFAATGHEVMLAVVLVAVLVLGRVVGGFVTARVCRGTQALFVMGTAFSLVHAGSGSLVALFGTAATLSALSGWASWQFFELAPTRPAFAYALQKIPLFVGTLLVTVVVGLGQRGVGVPLVRAGVLMALWLLIAFLWYKYVRKKSGETPGGIFDGGTIGELQ